MLKSITDYLIMKSMINFKNQKIFYAKNDKDIKLSEFNKYCEYKSFLSIYYNIMRFKILSIFLIN
jgi:hypothetical protein